MEYPLPALLSFPVILLEVILLLLAERKFGVRVIRGNEDPRDLLEAWPRWVAFFWICSYVVIFLYVLSLVLTEFRLHGISLIVVTILGTLWRKFVSIKWILVLLTLESATRIGLYANLGITVLFFK